MGPEAFERAFREAVVAETDAPPVTRERLRIALVIGSLSPGGAERQLCNLANSLAARGHEVSILVTCGVDGTSSHYLELLKHHSIKVAVCTAPHPDFDFSPPTGGAAGVRADLVAAIPPPFKNQVWRLYTHMRMLDLDVVHCFLDHPNLEGSMAAWLADVPRIVMSVRNVNPTNFPYIDQPWLRPWYRVFEGSPRVQFSGNSRLGCEDYARWLGWPKSSFSVIHNGIDPSSLVIPPDRAVAELRAKHGLSEDTPVILGVFRLNNEKRPRMFVDIVRAVRRQIPDARAFVAGVGPMETEIEGYIEKLGLGDAITLLGRRHDVPVLMRAASLLLLTSDNEGTPNVALEAQWFERPVVCCDVGSCSEVVRHRVTGLVHERDDRDGMIAGCVELLRDAQLRRQYGAAGRAHVAAEYSLEQMVEGSLALYYSTRATAIPTGISSD